MSGYVLHPTAFDDLREIWEYIAADSLDAADRVLEEIHKTILALVPFPHQGHRRPDVTSRPLRFTTVWEYLIAYAADEEPLLVLAVIHGRLNRHRRLGPTGFPDQTLVHEDLDQCLIANALAVGDLAGLFNVGRGQAQGDLHAARLLLLDRKS